MVAPRVNIAGESPGEDRDWLKKDYAPRGIDLNSTVKSKTAIVIKKCTHPTGSILII